VAATHGRTEFGNALAWREAVDQWRNAVFREGPICDPSIGRMTIPRSDRRERPIVA